MTTHDHDQQHRADVAEAMERIHAIAIAILAKATITGAKGGTFYCSHWSAEGGKRVLAAGRVSGVHVDVLARRTEPRKSGPGELVIEATVSMQTTLYGDRAEKTIKLGRDPQRAADAVIRLAEAGRPAMLARTADKRRDDERKLTQKRLQSETPEAKNLSVWDDVIEAEFSNLTEAELVAAVAAIRAVRQAAGGSPALATALQGLRLLYKEDAS